MSSTKKFSKGRAWITEVKQQLQCEVCEEDAYECLEFHHLDPTEKDFSLSNAARRGYSVEKLKNEIEKCAVLCSNCHKKLHTGRIDLKDHDKNKIHQVNRNIIFGHSESDARPKPQNKPRKP